MHSAAYFAYYALNAPTNIYQSPPSSVWGSSKNWVTGYLKAPTPPFPFSQQWLASASGSKRSMKRASETPHNNDILKLFSHMEATLIFFSRGRTGVLSREWMSNWNLLFLKKNAKNIDKCIIFMMLVMMTELRALLLLNWPRPCVE